MLTPCPRCGTEFEPVSGKYAPDGTIVCVPCGEQLSVAQKAEQKRVAGSPFIGAAASVLIALMSLIVEHKFVFFLLPLVAVGVGAGAAYSALRNPESAAALGPKRIPTVVLGVLGALLGLASLISAFASR